MSSLDRDLHQAEEWIRSLSREYQMYVSGQRRRRPLEEREKLDHLMRKLGSIGVHDNADRFRIQNLTIKYNLYTEKWAKQLREYEEGPTDPKARAKLLGAAYRKDEKAPAAPAPSPDAKPRRTVELRVGAESPDDIQKLYDLYRETRAGTGEGRAVDFAKFETLVRESGATIAKKSGRDSVEFDVKVKDGKAKLVAKAKGGA